MYNLNDLTCSKKINLIPNNGCIAIIIITTIISAVIKINIKKVNQTFSDDTKKLRDNQPQ